MDAERLARRAEGPPRVRRGALGADALAGKIAAALAGGEDGEPWRWLLQFVDDFRGSSSAGRAILVEAVPPVTGDRRYDAAIAALVEHLCAGAGMVAPAWTGDPERFAEPWWFVAGLPGYRAAALRDSPISFKRHGVFVTKEAFERV
ncbi:MAG: hypothetical protein ACYC1D_01640 [Acidimicrobiales bacterium]